MRTEINKDCHCEGVYLPNRQGMTEAISLFGVVNEFGCTMGGLLRATAHAFASARNDRRDFGFIEMNR